MLQSTNSYKRHLIELVQDRCSLIMKAGHYFTNETSYLLLYSEHPDVCVGLPHWVKNSFPVAQTPELTWCGGCSYEDKRVLETEEVDVKVFRRRKKDRTNKNQLKLDL